jgi:hypothetical protein
MMTFHVTREQVLCVLGQAYVQQDYSRGEGLHDTHYIVQNNYEREEEAFWMVALAMEAAERHKLGNFDTIDLAKLIKHLK